MFTQPSNHRVRLIHLTALVVLAVLASACAPAVGSANPTEVLPAAFEAVADPTGMPGEARPAQIDDVTVEIGVGSPIPVFAIISGVLPSPCDQIAQVLQERKGTAFQFTVLTTSTEPPCIPDTMPFILRVPLNVVNLAPAEYQVQVNDKQAAFNLEAGSAEPIVAEEGTAPIISEAVIEGVDLQVGVGSPIPRHLIISGTLPDTCAQLGEIQLRRVSPTGNGFHIGIMTTSLANDACLADPLPFRLEFPINLYGIEADEFNVRVNRFEASFDSNTVPVSGTAVAGADTTALDTSNWQPFKADSGYEIRYPLALYSVRDAASPSDVLYPGVKAITPNDSFYYGKPHATTYKISIAVRENGANLTLDNQAELLAGSALMQYDPQLLAGHDIQAVTLDGVKALRVDGLEVGPTGVTAQIVTIHNGLIYELLVEPYQITGNQAEPFDIGGSNSQSEALFETILAAFKFNS